MKHFTPSDDTSASPPEVDPAEPTQDMGTPEAVAPDGLAVELGAAMPSAAAAPFARTHPPAVTAPRPHSQPCPAARTGRAAAAQLLVQSTQPKCALAMTRMPKAMRYHANTVKSWCAMYRSSPRTAR